MTTRLFVMLIAAPLTTITLIPVLLKLIILTITIVMPLAISAYLSLALRVGATVRVTTSISLVVVREVTIQMGGWSSGKTTTSDHI